jgi:hypothetical protein
MLPVIPRAIKLGKGGEGLQTVCCSLHSQAPHTFGVRSDQV